jgi:sugar lactone lactonase YvrE
MTDSLAAVRTIGSPEIVHRFMGAMPTGVAVSRKGRVFVNFPRWEDPITASVVELVGGREVPFPDPERNRWPEVAGAFVCVQSVVIDARDRLWLLDTGMGENGLVPGATRLVGIDLERNEVVTTVVFPPDVVPPGSYLNDVRFDLRRGKAGTAFVTDSSEKGALVVADLASGRSWRRLADHESTHADRAFVPVVESEVLRVRGAGEPARPFRVGADSLALAKERVFYSPLTCRRLYSVSAEVLADPDATDDDVARTLEDHGEKVSSDGLEADDAGRIYVTSYEHNAVLRRDGDGTYETLVASPHLLWPDSLSLAHDGYLYVTANQLHRSPRFHGGVDRRVKPYLLLRIPVDGRPLS